MWPFSLYMKGVSPCEGMAEYRMNIIKRIFLNDLKHVISNFFILVIVVGVCILPALYAWCNIYSNWDPYGNTGNLKVAAVSLDEGYKDKDGTYSNSGEAIIENLHDNDKIDWQFVETEEEAIAGVKDGSYYAALVVPKDFTYNMYNILFEDVDKPQLIFYQNQKINPVANKITDTVVGTIQSNIEEQFIKTMTQRIFEGTNTLSSDLEEDGGVDRFIEKLKDINKDLISYQDTINVAIRGNATLAAAAGEAQGDTKEMQKRATDSANTIGQAATNVAQSKTTLNGYTSQVNTSVDSIQNTLSGAIATLNEAKVSNDLKAMTDAAAKVNQDLTEINEKLGNMATSLPTDPNTQAALKVLQENVKTVNKAMDLVITAGNNAVDNNLASKREDAISAINTAITNLENMQKQITNNLMPQINQSLDGLTQILENSQNLMNNMASVLGGMNNIFGSLQVTANSATTSLEKTSEALGMLSDRLTDAIEKVEAAADGDKAKILMETLSGDPEMYGEFFAEPVHIETEVLYPVDNYGSAVTPFYTTLAIWVGALILTAILKVHPDHTKYEGAKGWQLFFGRYALFFLMGQLQTLITVLGDLKFLHVQCLHPVYFWLASAVTSMIFSLLIYSLVSAFGDVGKAAAVVIVVLQIAGSSGTYPIELLPEFFQKVYIFFPFPYAINAMRESVAGFYEHDYLIYLLQLCLFIPVSLAIGIWIRRPFKKMNHFMEERMEETEMM